MLNYDIMYACLGNGITVCNRAQMENGDYKIIAHISNGGNIKYRVSKDKLPAYVIESIENMADAEKKRFRENFIKLPRFRQYEIILDSLPWSRISPKFKGAYNNEELWKELLNEYFEIA